MLPQVGGTRGDRLPFPIGEKRSSELSAQLDPLLGMEVFGQEGNVYRLVRLNLAAGLSGGAPAAGASQACGRIFTYTLTATGVHAYDVKLAQRTGTVPANRPVGVGVQNQAALDDNDYFWIHVDGPYFDLWAGDDGTNFVIGDYVALDDDADLGCVYSLSTTFTPEFLIGICLTTEAGVDATVRVRPYKKLQA